ncbi:MAG: shikimate dehydrogenase [Methylococcaceae bacterium]|nr:shikimate dehydrogenase [Methylococcaceae bacterium]
MSDRYAVFGHPIGHSKSPRIHRLFAEQTGQDLQYDAWDVPAERFEAALAEFLATGGRGLNCTVPLKELAFHAAARLTDRARRACAVNTLALETDRKLVGDNTDGSGLLRDLRDNLGLRLEGKSILILGAGGAVRGILQPLLEANPGRLLIANRTAARAEQLAGEFAALGPVAACGFERLLAEAGFELILNATAASLSGQLPPLGDALLLPGGCCYALAYASAPTPFVEWGRNHGAALSVDGIGMLVEQAAEAFQLWRGVRPATAPVIRLLNAERGWS